MTSRNSGARPQDFTGRKKAELAEQHAAEVKARTDLAMMNQAAEAEILDEVVDTTAPKPAPVDPGPTELLEVDGVQVVQDATRVIRLREDCDPTIGAGNHYNFKAMVPYKVPKHVADHLEEVGLVYH